MKKDDKDGTSTPTAPALVRGKYAGQEHRIVVRRGVREPKPTDADKKPR